MFEDGQPQIVHRPLADGDGAGDLSDGQEPAQKQVPEENQTHDEDALVRRLSGREIREMAVNPDLNQFGTEERRDSGQDREQKIQNETLSVGQNITHEPKERGLVHPLLRELLFDG